MTARTYRSPEHERAYACFNNWMRRPDQEDRYADLIAAMNEHELKDRLRRLLPPVPVPLTSACTSYPSAPTSPIGLTTQVLA